MYLNKISLIFSFLLVSNLLFGEINIYYVQPTISGACNGKIKLDASGSAGPFTITLKGAGQIEIVVPNINGSCKGPLNRETKITDKNCNFKHEKAKME